MPERVALSIIVPMLNEAAALPGLLPQLAHWRTRGCEVVLVDGGSTDGSADMARAAGFTVVDAERGRARQMNAGATAAGGAVLLFLHADTQLPADADVARISAAVSSPPPVSTSETMTLAPSAANFSAVARPIPAAALETSATFPASNAMSDYFRSGLRCRDAAIAGIDQA